MTGGAFLKKMLLDRRLDVVGATPSFHRKLHRNVRLTNVDYQDTGSSPRADEIGSVAVGLLFRPTPAGRLSDCLIAWVAIRPQIPRNHRANDIGQWATWRIPDNIRPRTIHRNVPTRLAICV